MLMKFSKMPLPVTNSCWQETSGGEHGKTSVLEFLGGLKNLQFYRVPEARNQYHQVNSQCEEVPAGQQGHHVGTTNRTGNGRARSWQ
jgi:hypothetical protein